MVFVVYVHLQYWLTSTFPSNDCALVSSLVTTYCCRTRTSDGRIDPGFPGSYELRSRNRFLVHDLRLVFTVLVKLINPCESNLNWCSQLGSQHWSLWPRTTILGVLPPGMTTTHTTFLVFVESLTQVRSGISENRFSRGSPSLPYLPFHQIAWNE